MAYATRFPSVPLTEALNAAAHASENRNSILLIVDDEELIVHTLSAILSAAGFTVLTAFDGASALEVAKVIPPDLLITDVAMPGMDGVQLGINMVNNHPGCRVLLFSAHAQFRDLDKARQAGFDFPLLTKPVHPRTMLANVHQCLQLSAFPSPLSASARSLQLASLGPLFNITETNLPAAQYITSRLAL